MRFFLLVTFFVFSAGSLQATDNKTPQFLDASPKNAQPFTRIVSLAPVITETLFALGVGDRLVGVTRFCDRPAQASKIPKVGGFVDGSLERILGLKPDLVVAMPQQAQRGLLQNIQQHGVPVYLVFGDTISEIKQLIHGLGTLLKEEKKADHLTKKLQTSYDAFHGALAKHQGSIVVVAGVKPLVLAGPKTFIHESLAHMGLTPLPQKNAPLWPVWSLEHLVATQPDWVLFLYPGAGVTEMSQRLKQLCPKGCQSIVFESPVFQRPGIYLPEDLNTVQDFFLKTKRIPHEK